MKKWWVLENFNDESVPNSSSRTRHKGLQADVPAILFVAALLDDPIQKGIHSSPVPRLLHCDAVMRACRWIPAVFHQLIGIKSCRLWDKIKFLTTQKKGQSKLALSAAWETGLHEESNCKRNSQRRANAAQSACHNESSKALLKYRA